MKHFLPIATGIDTVPLMNALASHPELWDANTLRTKHPGTAHASVSDIWVWFNDPGVLPKGLADLGLDASTIGRLRSIGVVDIASFFATPRPDILAVPNFGQKHRNDVNDAFARIDNESSVIANDREVIPFPAWTTLPQIRPLVFDLMRRVEAVRLGRVIITKLPAGKTITPHTDGGAPAEFFTRYQIALQSLPGVLFRIGDECVQFQRGDCWRIDNRTVHSVENNSADDRVVVIVDLRLA